MPMAWIFLTGAVIANVASNLAFKRAMQDAPEELSFSAIFPFLFNPFLWIGGLSCCVLLACYLLAIRDLGLSISYAFVTSLSLVGISTAAAILFRETLTLQGGIGIALVIAGLLTLSTAGQGDEAKVDATDLAPQLAEVRREH